MSNQNFAQENKHHITPKPDQKPEQQADTPGAESPAQRVQRIQRRLGNRAVQRVLAQRAAENEGGFTVDEDTEQRINSQRGGGQPLDVGIQQKMQDAIGYDFSGVRVHTSPEAGQVSQSLQAKAFTTGSDVYFNEGEYQPNSSSGQELIAHELTHVVQQGSGKVSGGGGGMTVNAPNDRHEQEADATAKQALSAPSTSAPAASAQRQEMPEEEELQTKQLESAQREPEEEELQTKPLDSAIQREGMPEEEELQTKPLNSAVQREEIPEEELQAKRMDAVQRQELPEEEELQTKPLERQELDEDEQAA